jgi:hypothetical protein
VSGVTRLALDDGAPSSRPPIHARPPAAFEPLDAFQTIATRDVFNAGPLRRAETTSAARLWGVGMHGDEAVRRDRGSGDAASNACSEVGDEIGRARITASMGPGDAPGRRGEHTCCSPPSPAPRRASAARPASGGCPPTLPRARSARPDPDSYIVDRGALTGAVDNTSGLLTQLRAVRR